MTIPALSPASIPLSLYVHIPWCERKCPYCDFNSHTLSHPLPEHEYVDALLADLKQDLIEHASLIKERKLQSIFIGGGTPSLLTAQAVARLLDEVRRHISCPPDLEVTLEANPGSADAAKFSDYRRAGVNRLSIGVQSFNDVHLRGLGRIHTGAEALAAISAARQAGFDNINLDLMFGLPNQDIADARADIEQAIACAPQHVSCYQLTIEPNTWFHHQPPALPDDDSVCAMQSMLRARLQDSGYLHYEVSAFAHNNNRCRHNLNYWRFGDYLGIGAGAHGKLSGPAHILRTWKVKHPRRYLELAAGPDRTGGLSILDTDTITLEFMLNALRLREPVSETLFTQRTGLPIAAVAAHLARARDDGLLVWRDAAFYASDRGFRFLNELLGRFVPDQSVNTTLSVG